MKTIGGEEEGIFWTKKANSAT